MHCDAAGGRSGGTMIGSKPGSFSTHAGVVGKDLGEPTETTSCRDAPLMGIDWRASMETVVGCLSDAEAKCASGVSLFDKDQMLGAAEKKLKDRTVSGEEGDVCWSVSMSESHFVVFCSMLLFVINLLMRAGPGHQGWDSMKKSL
jgi:hypothetical protein